MKKAYIILGAAAILIVLGGFLLLRYGKARYNEGYLKAHSQCIENAVEHAGKAAKELRRIQNETKKLSDTDVDDDLLDLGIMRNDTDY